MTSNDRNSTDESTGHGKLETAAATALAAGAGISATAGTATAQETQDVVIKSRDFYPNEEFVVLTNFEERNRVEFLEEYDDGEDAFSDHDDWEVYSILVEVGEPAGELGVIMIDNDVDPDPGDRGTMGDSPSFWDSEWDLLEVEATFNDDDNDENDNNDNDDNDDENDENDDNGILG
ncbi:calcium-binding protein [Natronolimnohabitans sp. A-GB9]|uniref:calcium-binding protein n=1 Tax=Natronolimnohabitans sp. A-GB9 TaxID=3069757 RepID=UPI0027B0A23C|nr:calcium-binding protein [Natronolimnohabitans sp. A-GB9]MDQ2050150.1 calcium-binding protein [Natronolimnohabitans sp. A-GB9]